MAAKQLPGGFEGGLILVKSSVNFSTMLEISHGAVDYRRLLYLS